MGQTESAPVLSCRLLGGSREIPEIVDDLISSRGLSAVPGGATPEMLEILALALSEVLHSINEFAGQQTLADDASVELWVEESLVIICAKFHGQALPDWLLMNWDRGQEPSVLAPSSDIGWGWLLVREALDSVSHTWNGSQQILFLERRI